MRPAWDLVDETTRLYRATYAFGYGGRASAVLVGLGDDALALISPPAGWAAPELFDGLEGLGRVTHIVAPNGLHRLGLPEAQRRFPEARVFAPRGWLKRVRKVSPSARPLDDLQGDLPDHVELTELPHMQRPEAFMRLSTPQGRAWYLNDVVTNIEALPEGVLGFLVDALGFREGLALNSFGCRWVTRAIRPQWGDWLGSELRDDPPALLVAGHGPVERREDVLTGLPQLLAPLGS
jgi:hypothetical protein